MNSGENKAEGGGDPNETTAVTRAPERPSNGKSVVKIIFGFALGVAVVCLASKAITCAMKSPDKRATVETRVNQIAVDVAMLQGQMGLTTARTSVLEVRTSDLEANANTDRESALKLAKTVKELAEQVDKKADAADVERDYARKGRVGRIERKLDRHMADIQWKPPAPAVAEQTPGTVTVKVVTVPVNPDEE